MASIDAMNSDAVAAAARYDLISRSIGVQRSAIKSIGDAANVMREGNRQRAAERQAKAEGAYSEMRQAARSIATTQVQVIFDVISALLTPTIPSGLTQLTAITRQARQLNNQRDIATFELYNGNVPKASARSLTVRSL